MDGSQLYQKQFHGVSCSIDFDHIWAPSFELASCRLSPLSHFDKLLGAEICMHFVVEKKDTSIVSGRGLSVRSLIGIFRGLPAEGNIYEA